MNKSTSKKGAENMQDVLCHVKEAYETSDIHDVAKKLQSGKWIAFGARQEECVTWIMGRVAE